METNVSINSEILAYLKNMTNNIVEVNVDLSIQDEGGLKSVDFKIGETSNNYVKIIILNNFDF